MIVPTISLRGTVGVWSSELRGNDRSKVADCAATLDALGYHTLWVPGRDGGELFLDVNTVLDSAPNAVVVPAVLNIRMHDSSSTAAWYAEVRQRHPGRLLLGLGAGHAFPNHSYSKPLSEVRAYVDALETDKNPISAHELLLAALGPKMLRLAAERTVGAHTYFVTPAHTHTARQIMGPDSLLVPELKVVWDDNPDRARATARKHLAAALRMPNYSNNLLRLGFSETDITHGGSDLLIDGTVAWGSVDMILKRIREHLDAGADHVCIQILASTSDKSPVKAWTELAPAVLSVNNE